jgi:hypothetical protein
MSCVAGGAETLGPGGNFAVESVAIFAWNGWQLSCGIGGNFAVEYAHDQHGLHTAQIADLLALDPRTVAYWLTQDHYR